MRKRFTLRSLMFVVAILAIGLVPIRIHRQYRADRVVFNRLVGDHKFASLLKDESVKSAGMWREVMELERTHALMMRRAMEGDDRFQRGKEESGRPPVFIGPLGGLARDSGDKRPDDSSGRTEAMIDEMKELASIRSRFEAHVEEWTRKEAAARAAIDRFKATHWWF